MIYNWGCIIIMKTKMEYKPYSDDRNIISPFLFDVVFLLQKNHFEEKYNVNLHGFKLCIDISTIP